MASGSGWQGSQTRTARARREFYARTVRLGFTNGFSRYFGRYRR